MQGCTDPSLKKDVTGAMHCRLTARFWACLLVCGALLGVTGQASAQPLGQPPLIVITSVDPAIAQSNVVITIHYSTMVGLPSELPQVFVYIDGEKSDVLAVTHALIQARVPAFKAGGKKSIVVTGGLVTNAPWDRFEVVAPPSTRA